MGELQQRVDLVSSNFTNGLYVTEPNEKIASHAAGYALACKDILNLEVVSDAE
jgi:hypothetical protein